MTSCSKKRSHEVNNYTYWPWPSKMLKCSYVLCRTCSQKNPQKQQVASRLAVLMLASLVSKHASLSGKLVSFPANASNNTNSCHGLIRHRSQTRPAALTVSPRPHELVQHRSHLCLGRHVSECLASQRCVSHSSPASPHTCSLLNSRPRWLLHHHGQLFPQEEKARVPLCQRVGCV